MATYYSPSKNGFFDETINYPSLPADKIKISKEEHVHLIHELNANNKTIVVVNNEITLVEKEPMSMTWEIVRHIRNSLLKDSDHTQLPDFPPAKKTEWATYRQALRDIPQTYATPEEVIWPIEPT